MTETFEQALARWQSMAKELARLKSAEAELRAQLFQAAFPEATEGVNKRELSDGSIVKGDYKINRSVDPTAVSKVVAEMRAASNEINPDDVFKIKIELGIGAYKRLPPKLRVIADRAITAKPGTPTLEVI